MPFRYAELKPDELPGRWTAVLPLGALEWHGPHLPLGTDGFLATAFAERLAERCGGILLPTLWTPITTLPHRTSLQISTETFGRLMDDMIASLHGAGASVIAFVTGHYAQGHEIELYEAALRAMDDLPGLRVFAATPLEPIGDPNLLDHAGWSETAQLLAVDPSSVNVAALPTELDPKQVAVLGDDPRSATASDGERLLEQGLDAWTAWLESDVSGLRDWYGQAFDRYQPYVDAYYRGSWEDAIHAWWATK